MADEPDAEELRATIERTRSDLGDTVAALAGKADVKARASGAVHHAVDRARGRAHSAVDGAKSKAHNLSDGARSRAQNVSGSAKSTAQNMTSGARERASGAAEAARERAQELAGAARERTAGVSGRSGRHAAPAHGPQDAALESVHRDTGLDVHTAAAVSARDGRGRLVTAQRVQAALLVASVGAVLGAIGVWVRGRSR